MTEVLVPTVDPDRELGDLVAERPARARVFERVGIDYCCHGQRSLRTAAESAGLDVAALAAELETVRPTRAGAAEEFPLAGLVEHPSPPTTRTSTASSLRSCCSPTGCETSTGRGTASWRRVAELVRAVHDDLEPHMAKEERVLFPAILRVLEGERDFPFGSIGNPIGVMQLEHERTGALLAELPDPGPRLEVPADASASYRALYERLDALEADTFQHIHLENNVLFPAVEAIGT